MQTPASNAVAAATAAASAESKHIRSSAARIMHGTIVLQPTCYIFSFSRINCAHLYQHRGRLTPMVRGYETGGELPVYGCSLMHTYRRRRPTTTTAATNVRPQFNNMYCK